MKNKDIAATSQVSKNISALQIFNDNKNFNHIIEYVEREKISRFLVENIMNSLDLDQVLQNTVNEIGKLLNADRCLITLYDKDTLSFQLKAEFKANKNICSIDPSCINENFSKTWLKHILIYKAPVVIDNKNSNFLSDKQFKCFNYCIKSLVSIPLFNKTNLIGAIIVHQVESEQDWDYNQIQFLKDIGNQIAIAIIQAELYTKVKQSAQTRSDFIARMSHEFRTPLNAILGFSEMLLAKDYDKDKQKCYLNNISNSGKYLLHLINNLMDISKIEAGSMDLIYEEFNTAILIKNIVESLRSLTYPKSITINLDIEGIMLDASKEKVTQILYNLLSNSIKYTKPNGTINIKSRLNAGKIVVMVEDTGIGFAKKDYDKVFAHFKQIDSTYARSQEGSGLGLALTKSLVELQGGTIHFESEENKGSRFWFVLPNAKLIS